ncbi:MAG: response regulator [Deltaproteobacteria bacterium]|jgi:DNA-binding NtrC family response regulator|nr:response regulator [Deltaproteobacteria bacterium]
MAAPFIMLVDDEVPFVKTMSKRLNKRNIKTIMAYRAEEGLEKLKENKDLDVIVLDIKMPGMDGIEALKEIKALAPLVEVIMLTGHATIESAIKAMKLGAHDFLMKPFDIEELVLKIKEAAENKQQHEEKIKEAFKQETLSKYGPFYYT